MPIIAQIDCPYCGTKKSGFQAEGQFRRLESYNPMSYNHSYEDWVFMSCGNCRQTISAVYLYNGKNTPSIDIWSKKHGDPKNFGFKYTNHYPKETAFDEPKFVPDKVLIPYQQAISNITSSNWDAAGTMARKTLDVATKDMVRTEFETREEEQERLLKKPLHFRIEELEKHNLLTKALAELAYVLKNEGNDASHEEEPYAEDDARKIAEYAQALLTYIYTIPGMVAEVRAKDEVGKEETPTE